MDDIYTWVDNHTNALIAELRDYLVSDELTLDTYKGAPGGYRPWDRQLRQPVLLHSHNAVVARAPIDGFLHEKNNLDTLGSDERDSACRSAKQATDHERAGVALDRESSQSSQVMSRKSPR